MSYRQSRHLISTCDNSSTTLPSLRIPWSQKQQKSPLGTAVSLSTTCQYDDQSSHTIPQKKIFSNKCEVSNLNGLRVASERVPGGFSTLGVAINAGPRFEGNFPKGISHFLTKLAFGPTLSYPKRSDVLNILEQSGAIFDCQISHDIILYAVSCRTDCLSDMLHLLSECILRPVINEEEINNAKKSVFGEIDDLEMKPDPTPIMNELIHKAAYGQKTLGLSQFCQRDSLEILCVHHFHQFMSKFYQNSRIAVCCVGNVDHSDFIDQVGTHFMTKQRIYTSDNVNDDDDTAKWEGSYVMVEKDLSNVSLGPTPMPELIHLSIGLEAPNFNEPCHITACVLQSLMGGGGSFSAGGPGKGMYSRMYLRVLNNYGWMNSSICTTTSYSDSGLFSIYTSCFPGFEKQMANLTIREILALLDNIGEEEILRAKNQLKASVLMNLEQRSIAFEDISRQVLGTGIRRHPNELCAMIDSVSAKDIKDLVMKMLNSKPAIAALGSIRNLPDHKYFISQLRPHILRRIFK
ncbi:hypothetical protein GJ496_003335 [Pomphorhynchus laevis]|nr:hypothetical protein GJ496_003335 [Pomphorhynchus laevis]